MSIFIRSLLSESQTLDGVALPAWGLQRRGAISAAMAAARTAKSIYIMSDVGDAKRNLSEYTFIQATGTTVTLRDDAELVKLDHAATIAALTILMPAAPIDGSTLTLAFKSAVTTLTLTATVGHTIQGTLAAATAAGFATWKFDSMNLTWYRVS